MVRKPRISICASTDEQSRKARKRATDRNAQQEHRLRQKEYVRNLEKTVEELKAERPRDEVIRKLLEEKSRLQERCHALTTRLSRIRTLVVEDGSITHGSGLQKHYPSSDEIHDSAPSDPHLDDLVFHDVTSIIEGDLVWSQSGTSPGPFFTGVACHDTDANNEIVVADDDRGESPFLSGRAKNPPPPSRANAPSTVDDILSDLTLFAPADHLVTLT
ncbi:hypothetical protein AnigIFM49718_010784 [Aspergillus niger]|nr:hypothetical protein AnigIFM49718_010784 [Aspergillus niger]GLA21648.1 hypothetical protein AnigIFM62618_011679 [Aspergillus niger]